MKKISLTILLMLMPTLAFAQSPVITYPKPVTNIDNQSSSIAVTNTFQQVFPASQVTSGRSACTIQNTGTNPMYVYFGTTANATLTNSLKLLAGQSCNCNVGNVIIKTAVQITGTATETYYAAQQ